MKVRIEFDATAHFSFVREMTKKEFDSFKSYDTTILKNDPLDSVMHERLIGFINQDNDTFDYILHDTDIEDIEVSKEKL